MVKASRLAGLESALQYHFENRDTAERSLTHSSARGASLEARDNERLEFIGDRVLGLVVAEMLGERLPEAREGELAQRYNQLVRRETCAAVARQLELGRYLILSGSEAESGGRDKDTILADAMEALLAAIFLEGGYETVRILVRRLWGPMIELLPEQAQDPKSALQEWAQGRGLPLPKYDEIGRTGPDHAPVFESEVGVKGFKPARGSGSSKRLAEQAAATEMLVREGVWAEPSDDG
jgi:ribonuclease III